MNLPLFIARRIYGNEDDRRKVSRPAIRIATLGVGIGLAVMIITVSVVLGFQHSIRDKVVGFGSHIQVMNIQTFTTADPYKLCLDDSLMTVLKSLKGVRHAERYAMTQGILKTDEDFLGVLFKGVGAEYDMTFLKQHLLEGDIPTFSDSSSTNKLLVSKMIADKMKLKSGDRIYAYYIDDNIRTRRYTVCGIYQTNMTRFDESLCFTDLYTVEKINGWEKDEVTGAELLVNDFDKLEETNNEVIMNVNRSTDKLNNTLSSQTIYDGRRHAGGDAVLAVG